MEFQWMRRVLLALAPAALLALAACGSGTIESQFTPTRLVVMGDALSDMGNTSNSVNAAARYTVNDSNRMWPQAIATSFNGDLTITASAAGGTNYAVGNARVALKPDAAGNSSTPTVSDQVTTYLAANGGAVPAGDLVIINGGISDIIVQVQALRAGTLTQDQALENVKQAGRDLAAQAKRLVAAGGAHVVVLSVPDLKNTPWAAAISQQSLLSTLSTEFNNSVLLELVNEGKNILFSDIALLFNLMTANPSAYGFVDTTTPVCNSVDPGPGIGIGANQVNSARCTTATTAPASGNTYLQYLWADAIYPTPTVETRIADYIYQRVHSRW